MGSPHPSPIDWLPTTVEERAALLAQVDRILASPGFRASRKYPAMLRAIVELTLDGKVDHLKERSLGIAVFGRDPDYDTSADPVIRVVAGEIRKRLAQYYHESSANEEIVIELPPGSYIPKFRPPSPEWIPTACKTLAADPAAPPVEVSDHELPLAVEAVGIRRAFRQRLFTLLHVLGAALVLTFLVGGATWVTNSRRGPVDRLWGPLINAREPVLVLLGRSLNAPSQPPDADPSGRGTIPPPSIGDYQMRDSLTLGEATALSLVTNVLGHYNKPYSIQRARSMDLTLLRNGPVVVIGGFNNMWTRRLTAGLRFTLEQDRASQTTWIEDRKDKDKRNWQAVDSVPYVSATDDWAIVARFRNPTTEHPVLIISGLKIWGTSAAGEFVSKSAYVAELAKTAPANWEDANLEAVITTRVINGVSGPPRVVAVEFW